MLLYVFGLRSYLNIIRGIEQWRIPVACFSPSVADHLQLRRIPRAAIIIVSEDEVILGEDDESEGDPQAHTW